MSSVIGFGVFILTILGSAFREGNSLLHHMRVYARPFSIKYPVKVKYRLYQSTPQKSPNTGFILSTGLVNNPLVPTQFYNSMLYRYSIRNCGISVLINPMKWKPCFHNYLAAGTDAKYESAQNILSMSAHGITIPFSTCVPLGRLSSSYYFYASCLTDLTILSRIRIPDRSHTSFWISAPLPGFLSIATRIGKPILIQWLPCLYHLDMDSSSQMISKL